MRDCFTTCQSWMHTELGLTGNEMIIYSTIYGYSSTGSTFNGGYSYFKKNFGISKPTYYRIIDELLKKNLIQSKKKINGKDAWEINAKIIEKLSQNKISNGNSDSQNDNSRVIKMSTESYQNDNTIYKEYNINTPPSSQTLSSFDISNEISQKEKKTFCESVSGAENAPRQPLTTRLPYKTFKDIFKDFPLDGCTMRQHYNWTIESISKNEKSYENLTVEKIRENAVKYLKNFSRREKTKTPSYWFKDGYAFDESYMGAAVEEMPKMNLRSLL